ncbi:MAG: hypothetical protein KAR35_09015 [Candidatus Heimdallarchaeota archaeon]|nr:hypothetical protein [Candidatus Heimdallarchaeota archaeon]MCK5049496.1 hypothetical protein [Candidatus Heimdallarchaeota archaeon]
MPVCLDCGAFYIRSPCPSCGYNKDKSDAQIIKAGPPQTKRSSFSPEDTPSWESANKGISQSNTVVRPRVPNTSPRTRTSNIGKDELQDFKDEVHNTLKQVVNLIEQLLDKTS